MSSPVNTIADAKREFDAAVAYVVERKCLTQSEVDEIIRQVDEVGDDVDVLKILLKQAKLSKKMLWNLIKKQ